MTFTNGARVEVASTSAAAREPVRSRCSSSSAQTQRAVVGVERLEADQRLVAARRRTRRRGRARTRCRRSCPRRSCGRSGRGRRTWPPVMYSQPWSPTPSTTASAPRVADREALARQAAEERAARRRAVERRVARDHVLVGARARVARPAGRRSRRRRGPCPRSR